MSMMSIEEDEARCWRTWAGGGGGGGDGLEEGSVKKKDDAELNDRTGVGAHSSART